MKLLAFSREACLFRGSFVAQSQDNLGRRQREVND